MPERSDAVRDRANAVDAVVVGGPRKGSDWELAIDEGPGGSDREPELVDLVVGPTFLFSPGPTLSAGPFGTIERGTRGHNSEAFPFLMLLKCANSQLIVPETPTSELRHRQKFNRSLPKGHSSEAFPFLKT